MSAVMMERIGWDVSLFDRTNPRDSGHGAFIVGAKTLAALDRCNVPIRGLGTALKQFSGYDFAENLQWTSSVRPLQEKYGFPLSYIGREQLISALLAAAPGASADFETGCSSISTDDGRTTVTLRDGRLQSFDLVIIADGVRSKLRNVVSNDAVLVNLPFFGLVGKVKDDFTNLEPGDLVDKVDGSDRMVFIRAANGYLYFKLSAFVDDGALLRRCRADLEFSRKFAVEHFARAECSQIQALLRRLENNQTEMLVYTGEHVLSQNQAWQRGRVIVIGDAAHGMTPALGQGANQAIMDAIALGLTVDKRDELEDALSEFESTRKGFLKSVSALSTSLTLQYAPTTFSTNQIRNLSCIPNRLDPDEANALMETLGFK